MLGIMWIFSHGFCACLNIRVHHFVRKELIWNVNSIWNIKYLAPKNIQMIILTMKN